MAKMTQMMLYDTDMENKNKIKISVVMPVYNSALFVGQSIESVLSQSCGDFEFVIVDDCSTDGSYDILCEYSKADSRIRLYKNEKNMGVSYTRTFAVSQAQGEYIALIDSDDVWTSDKLLRQVELCEKFPDTDICYTSAGFADTNSNRSDFVFHVPTQVDFKTLLKQNVISCSSVLVRKSVLEQYPMKYDHMHEDYASWLSALKNGCVARGIDEPMLIYRVDKTSKSGNKLRSAVMTYRVYRYIKINFFSRIYYMLCYTLSGMKKYKNI